MHEQLDHVPSDQRPRMIGALPRGASYFRRWRSLRWFLLLLVPPSASAYAFWTHGQTVWEAAGFLLLGVAPASLLFVFLCSGMSSSNTGTYFRHREPVRFWAEVAILIAVYIAISCCGYFA